ncbi:hypothetical protein B296_00052838 [Ensete ventricosum]|uniref:Uncharacterized protein n=1 Tax=Ensete ventricosum TaxID=4639 RepID=A0A426XDI8_ENSVE|nr:hypothetical protein B296_00052838 [Ensete ventricosum]
MHLAAEEVLMTANCGESICAQGLRRSRLPMKAAPMGKLPMGKGITGDDHLLAECSQRLPLNRCHTGDCCEARRHRTRGHLYRIRWRHTSNRLSCTRRRLSQRQRSPKGGGGRLREGDNHHKGD